MSRTDLHGMRRDRATADIAARAVSHTTVSSNATVNRAPAICPTFGLTCVINSRRARHEAISRLSTARDPITVIVGGGEHRAELADLNALGVSGRPKAQFLGIQPQPAGPVDGTHSAPCE